jgi:CRISPR-associated protein Cas2
MTLQKLFVFAYDISDDVRRVRVSKRLERHGVRVQDSVFEMRVTSAAAHAIAESIRGFLDMEDNLRVYHVPDMALKHCISVGGAPIPEPGNFLLF